MIGLDTNVLVRYFAQDDPVQSRKASALIESLTAERPGYVTQVALVEVAWVLGRAYDAGREEIAQVIDTLLKRSGRHCGCTLVRRPILQIA
jgi:predicted nucleic-acid-binding protein